MWDDDERNVHGFNRMSSKYEKPEFYVPVTSILKEMYEEEYKKLYKYEIVNNRPSCVNGGIKIDYVKDSEMLHESHSDVISDEEYLHDDNSEECEESPIPQRVNTVAVADPKNLKNEEKAVLNIEEIYEREVYKKFSYL